MSYENVKLWFAKDENDEIITIDNINKLNKQNVYHCPVCGSDLKPKAIESKRITPHFAHVDASKCNSESQIHFWFKNKFLEKGDKFTVISDIEKEYVCRGVLVEQSYETENGLYIPDVTIITECGNMIYFEMAFTNKKQVKDYLDKWLELKNIVVEVDVKQLAMMNEIPKFKALFYDGKCFNVKKRDTYYNTIGKYKEENLRGNVDVSIKERIRRLDWFWDDLMRYKKEEINIDDLSKVIENIDIKEKRLIYSILIKQRCSDVKNLCMKLKEELIRYNDRHIIHNFKNQIPSDSLIREAIKLLNVKYKKIDNGYKISLKRESNKYKSHYWRYGRKIGIWLVSSYNYRITLGHRSSGWYSKSINITNKIVDMKNVDDIFNYFDDKFKEHVIKIDCSDCKNEFELTSKEVIFYKEKGLYIPKRCKICRNKRKLNKNN